MNGSLWISNSVDFWYLLISLMATVPGLKRCGFFTPPVEGAVFLGALVTIFLRGFLPVPVVFLPVPPRTPWLADVLVRAISNSLKYKESRGLVTVADPSAYNSLMLIVVSGVPEDVVATFTGGERKVGIH